jgi:hypothetical protein
MLPYRRATRTGRPSAETTSQCPPRTMTVDFVPNGHRDACLPRPRRFQVKFSPQGPWAAIRPILTEMRDSVSVDRLQEAVASRRFES